MLEINKQYQNLLQEILKDGLETSPRGMPCYEILNHSIKINMKQPLITLKQRKLNYAFALDEACWIISGRNDVQFPSRHNKNLLNFSDNGRAFPGAYGPEILYQLNYVTNALMSDIDTRQSVLTIWRPNPGPSRDFPCTLTMQFLIRNNKLQMITNMRSQDMWWGFSYDILSFSHVAALVSLTIFEKTGYFYDLGYLYLNVGSRHIYVRDIENINEVIKDDAELFQYKPLNIIQFSSPEEFIEHLEILAIKGKTNHDWLSEIWNRD